MLHGPKSEVKTTSAIRTDNIWGHDKTTAMHAWTEVLAWGWFHSGVLTARSVFTPCVYLLKHSSCQFRCVCMRIMLFIAASTECLIHLLNYHKTYEYQKIALIFLYSGVSITEQWDERRSSVNQCLHHYRQLRVFIFCKLANWVQRWQEKKTKPLTLFTLRKLSSEPHENQNCRAFVVCAQYI